MACASERSESEENLDIGLELETYTHQRSTWPDEGRHILAQFTDDHVVVYQAYKTSIAAYAVENQSFGGPEYSYDRMSWIKTNFLWMMYRCGWATKKNQERVLAIKIKRRAFNVILANAYTVQLQKSKSLETKDISVRLQWDPDHRPDYTNVKRRAIQLGLKGDVLKSFGTEWIVSIKDITRFVKEQKKFVDKGLLTSLQTPKERVYPIHDYNVAARISLDSVS